MGPSCFLFASMLNPLSGEKPGREICTKREATILDLNVYLYLLLFLILVGLLVWSLLRRERDGNRRRDDRETSEAGTTEPGEGGQGE